MAPGNLEIVRRQVEATNRRDLDAFVALASEDVEWEDSMFWSEPTRIYRGRTELREWLERVLEPWDSMHLEVEEMIEAGDDLVFGGARLTTRGKGSGVQTRSAGGSSSRVVGDEVTTRQVFLDRGEGLEVAGLRG